MSQMTATRGGIVGIMPFKEFPRHFSYLKGDEYIPDFALIPETVEHGLPFSKLWKEVLKIAGNIVATRPNLTVIEEPNLIPPRISILSEVIDPLKEPTKEATYLEVVRDNVAQSNLMPVITI